MHDAIVLDKLSALLWFLGNGLFLNFLSFPTVNQLLLSSVAKLYPPSVAGTTHPLWHASSWKVAGSALLPPQEQLRPPVRPAIVSAIQNTLSVVSASSLPVTYNYLFPSFRFEEIGTLSSKTEVKTIELAQGPSRLLFTGDGAGELKVWTWAPQDEESPTPALP